MTSLSDWRQERGNKTLNDSLAEAKKLHDEAKLKALQELTASLKETERMAKLIDNI